MMNSKTVAAATPPTAFPAGATFVGSVSESPPRIRLYPVKIRAVKLAPTPINHKNITESALIPPTIDSDIYPNPNPNATIRSLSGIKDGLARKISVGDVIINPPGTPHWLSEIDGVIEYVEISISNVDPAPGIERAEIAPAKAK
jgi:hypothetical protein